MKDNEKTIKIADEVRTDCYNNVAVLADDVVWDSGVSNANYTTDTQWLRIIHGVWYIKKGYRWRSKVTADNWLSTLIGDIGYKLIKSDPNFPYTVKDIDAFFFNIARLKGSPIELFFVASLYIDAFFHRVWRKFYTWFRNVFVKAV